MGRKVRIYRAARDGEPSESAMESGQPTVIAGEKSVKT
jgi:hypothetical protein